MAPGDGRKDLRWIGVEILRFCLFCLVCGLASSAVKNFPCVLYGNIALFLGLAWVSFRNRV
jgi:hypothetical protein